MDFHYKVEPLDPRNVPNGPPHNYWWDHHEAVQPFHSKLSNSKVLASISSPIFLGFNGRLELESFPSEKAGVAGHHEPSYHPHQAHQAASAAAAAVAVAGLAPHQLVDSSDLSNELWLHASANSGQADFEAAAACAAAHAGFASKDPHHSHPGSANQYYQTHPHYDHSAAQALNLMEYSNGDMVPYGPDQMVDVQHQHYEFYEQPPIETFGYYDYVTT